MLGDKSYFNSIEKLRGVIHPNFFAKSSALIFLFDYRESVKISSGLQFKYMGWLDVILRAIIDPRRTVVGRIGIVRDNFTH